MPAILIGGTPCTGKSEVAQSLALRLDALLVSLGDIAEHNGCISDYDAFRDSGVIDEDCMVEAIIDLVEEEDENLLIIEGHYIDLVPSSFVKFAFILRAHPDILRERLKLRNYTKQKLDENVEAEVIGVCQMDSLFAFGEEKVYEIDTSTISQDEVVETILDTIANLPKPRRIDWMAALEEEGRVNEYLKD
jgi:adenylate kinase